MVAVKMVKVGKNDKAVITSQKLFIRALFYFLGMWLYNYNVFIYVLHVMYYVKRPCQHCRCAVYKH